MEKYLFKTKKSEGLDIQEIFVCFEKQFPKDNIQIEFRWDFENILRTLEVQER